MVGAVAASDQVNFLLTNRIPRRTATRLAGRIARSENRWVAASSMAVWRLFSTLDLSDAATDRFPSLHACFTRRLRPGARPFDPDASILASPCDAIVGEAGPVGDDGTLLQVKNRPYALADLLGDVAEARAYRGGTVATLRLTAAMYHRFHAPHDLVVRSVTHIAGDCLNVNGPTLDRVGRVFCRNERAIIRASLDRTGMPILLVPVAAILVAGIRLGFLDLTKARPHRSSFSCDAHLAKGDEMGWFEHGSTILVLAPPTFALCETVHTGRVIRAGDPLMRLPPACAHEG